MRICRSRGPSPGKRGGFSLLEVILAMAILAGSIAVLGEAIRLGMRNAQITCDMTQAQLLCASKLDEISSGLALVAAVPSAEFDCVVGDGQTIWLYSISLEATLEEGLDVVCVTVTQDNVPEPVTFSLYRWVPNAGAEIAAESTGTEDLETGDSGA